MKGNKKKHAVGKRIVDRLKGFADALEASDNISNRFTCRTVKLNLKPAPYSPNLVKKTRKLLLASQPIFAEFLGVSTSTIQDWEQGVNPPSRVACRLMDEIRRHPSYWRERLRELSTPVTA